MATKTQRQIDFEATTDFWDWARKQERLIEDKDEWPEFARIKHLDSECSFCEYFISRDPDGAVDNCEKCSLKTILGCCFYDNSWWRPFKYADTERSQIKLQQQSAEKIYQFCAEFCKKEFGG